jgi:DNA polymerase III delta prime subunit
LQDKEGIYQIPFIIEGEQKLVQLYVHQNNAKKKDVEEGLQIVISYDTKNMGTVMAKVKLKEEELSYIVKAQTRGATNLLGLANEALEKDLDAIGYKVIGKAYSEEKIPQQIHPVTIKHIESSFEKTI